MFQSYSGKAIFTVVALSVSGLLMTPYALADGSDPVLRPAVPSSPSTVKTTTTQTVETKTTGGQTKTTSVQSTEIHSTHVGDPLSITVERVRKDRRSACQMAQYHWLDKVAASNPSVIASICRYKSAAKILATHPRLGAVAEHDHYLCRRLTKWKSIARIMAANPEAQKVITLDPEGAYRAIKGDKRFSRILAKNPSFDQMVDDNPDLGTVLAKYM